MKQIYHHYELWEDVKNDILKDGFSEIEAEKLTLKAKSLLCNPKEFLKIANEVIIEWKYASEQHLSNKSRNRQAWLGQASCCFKYKVPEYITKYAWRLMTFEEQKKANEIADIIIKKWELLNAEKIYE
jgi:hypothetical protein